MITLEQYKSEYNKYIDKLTELKDRASRIKIWGYDRSPSMLMRRIETCIEKMKKVYPVFTTQPFYKNYDFTSYIDMITKDYTTFEKECILIEESCKHYKYK